LANKKHSLVFLTGAFLLSSLPISQAATEIPQAHLMREAAVKDAHAGKLKKAVAILQLARKTYPGDPFVLGDLIILLEQGHRDHAVSMLTKRLTPKAVPIYARVDWAIALRNAHHYAEAAQALKGVQKALGRKTEILYAMILAEAGKTQDATAALPSISNPGLSVSEMDHMAYVFRLANQPEKALQLSTRALVLSKGVNHSAIREEVFSLSDLGAAHAADHLAMAHKRLFHKDTIDRLIVDKDALNIRTDIAERKYFDNHDEYVHRNADLNFELKQAKSDNTIVEDDPTQYLRSSFNEIILLRALGKMRELVSVFHRLKQQHPQLNEIAQVPEYVLRALADAYLHLHDQRRAIALYRYLIATNPGIDVEVYMDLYYAYLANENYNKADKLISLIKKETPIWRYAKPPAKYRKVNWQRVNVDILWAMNQAYRNNNHLSLERLRTLHDRAPRNVGIMNSLATVERWNDWSTLAMQTTRLAAAYKPFSKATQLNLADNARDLGRYRTWDRTITRLHQLFPRDSSIRQSYLAYTDRSLPKISSRIEFGNSTGGGGLSTGNRDAAVKSALKSGWFAHNWQLFLRQQYLSAQFNNGSAHFNRFSLGSEWTHRRMFASVALGNDQLTGKNIGVSATWAQWLNDHWNYSLHGNTYALSLPLQAKQAGLRGESLGGSLLWRHSESLSAQGTLSLLAISDGNRRIDMSDSVIKQVFASPHHLVDAVANLWIEHNTQAGGAYFNPRNMGSMTLGVHHQWITWRHYANSLTQVMSANAGFGWESYYGNNPVFSIRYEQIWKFQHRLSFRYGIGLQGSRYDGLYGQRLYGFFGFSGVL
jgi:biofilm PGA synthesis protein PgaA